MAKQKVDKTEEEVDNPSPPKKNKSEPQFPKSRKPERSTKDHKFHIPSDRFGRPFNVDK